jgi:hypothetical protein
MTKKALIEEIREQLSHTKSGASWSGLTHRVGNIHWIWKTCVSIVDTPLKGDVAQYHSLRYDSRECTINKLRKINKLLKERI